MSAAVKLWTPRRYAAALRAIDAMLAGMEGEGDAAGVGFSDLLAARHLLALGRDHQAAERAARIDAKLRVELGKPRPTKAAAEPECECGHVRGAS